MDRPKGLSEGSDVSAWSTARLPLLEGEGWGEVWSISEEITHLTLSLSFQEREPAMPADRVKRAASNERGDVPCPRPSP